MKNKLILIVMLLLAVSFAGCLGNTPNTDPGMTGYVMQRDAERILVIDTEAQDFSETGGIDEFYNAIWFSDAPDNIVIGENVNVWFDVVADSYPGQAKAEHIEVIPSEKPDNADLTEAEALHKALMSLESDAGNLVVRSIEYEDEDKLWTIELKELWEEGTRTIEVDD